MLPLGPMPWALGVVRGYLIGDFARVATTYTDEALDGDPYVLLRAAPAETNGAVPGMLDKLLLDISVFSSGDEKTIDALNWRVHDVIFTKWREGFYLPDGWITYVDLAQRPQEQRLANQPPNIYRSVSSLRIGIRPNR